LKKLGIILAAHRQRQYVGPLLQSLARTIDPAITVIWAVDSASPDGTADEFEQQANLLGLPLHLIRSDENLGFMRGNNLAYAALKEKTPCEVVALLNIDTVVHPGWWQALAQELEDPAVGTAASLLLLPDGTVNSRGNALHFLGLGFVRDYGAAPDAPPLAQAGMFFGSCAALAFRPETLEALNRRLGTDGIFWDELFIYADDSDLGWRMRLGAYENRLVTSSRVTHDHRFWVDGLGAAGQKLFYLERNRYLLLLAYFKAPTLVLLVPWVAASELALALGVWKLYPRRLHLWRAVIDVVRQPGFLGRRRAVQQGRTAPDRAILSAMTGSIRHGAIPVRTVDRWLETGLVWSHRLLCFIARW
jgi:GT2 family glycosyltransferase